MRNINLQRRTFIHGALFSPAAFFVGHLNAAVTASSARAAPPSATPQTVTVVVDFSPEGAAGNDTSDAAMPPAPLAEQIAAARAPWEKWAGFDVAEKVVGQTLQPSLPGIVEARAVRNAKTRRVGVMLTNLTEQAVTVRLDTHLGTGLWRVDAAVFQAPTGDTTLPPEGSEPAADSVGVSKTWRMESVWRSSPGASVKKLPVRAGQTLFLRWTETAREAARALQAVQKQTASVGVRTYSGESVPHALGRVEDIIASLPDLIVKSKRDEITKRVHRALLTTAQAEAMAQNAQQARIDERDDNFDDLTRALSEISCACWNLVPRQVRDDKNGVPGLRVSVTNGGTRTVPLLSLALSGVSGGEAKNARPAFRGVAPGATVSARFPLKGDDVGTACGVVQFIVNMGAATVLAVPPAPELPMPADAVASAKQ